MSAATILAALPIAWSRSSSASYVPPPYRLVLPQQHRPLKGFYLDGDHHRKLVLTQYSTLVDAIINGENVQQEDSVGPALVGQAQLPVPSDCHDRGLYQANRQRRIRLSGCPQRGWRWCQCRRLRCLCRVRGSSQWLKKELAEVLPREFSFSQ